MNSFRRLFLCGFALVALGASRAEAADVQVLTVGTFRPVLDAVIPNFETRNTSKVTVTEDSPAGVAARIGRGEAFDLAILTQPTAADPARDGKVILVTPLAAAGTAPNRTTYVAAMNPKASETALVLLAMLAGPDTGKLLPGLGMGPP